MLPGVVMTLGTEWLATSRRTDPMKRIVVRGLLGIAAAGLLALGTASEALAQGHGGPGGGHGSGGRPPIDPGRGDGHRGDGHQSHYPSYPGGHHPHFPGGYYPYYPGGYYPYYPYY